MFFTPNPQLKLLFLGEGDGSQSLRGIPNYYISQFLCISTASIKSYIGSFQSGGLDNLLGKSRKDIKKGS